jgi:hypothetical protein
MFHRRRIRVRANRRCEVQQGSETTKLVYEALMRLAWKDVLPWLDEKHSRDLHHLDETLKNISSFHSNVYQGSFRELLGSE